MKIIEEALISCLNFSLKLINLKNNFKTIIMSAYLNNGLI